MNIGRKEVMDKFLELWGEVRNQKYEVHRGAVNWPNYDFDKHPLAVAVMMDECSFLGQINEGIVSFEIFAKITDDKKLNDVELETQLNNVMNVIHLFNKSISSIDPRRSIGAVLPKSEKCIEHYDISLNVQGLVILFSVKF